MGEQAPEFASFLKHGPSLAVTLEHKSLVPVNYEQNLGGTHPDDPFQTQFFWVPVGGYQTSQSESFEAVIFNRHVLSIQELVDIAVGLFVQGIPFPIKLLQVL